MGLRLLLILMHTALYYQHPSFFACAGVPVASLLKGSISFTRSPACCHTNTCANDAPGVYMHTVSSPAFFVLFVVLPVCMFVCVCFVRPCPFSPPQPHALTGLFSSPPLKQSLSASGLAGLKCSQHPNIMAPALAHSICCPWRPVSHHPSHPPHSPLVCLLPEASGPLSPRRPARRCLSEVRR